MSFQGLHDSRVIMSARKSVPTFYAGNPNGSQLNASALMALAVSIIFGGGVHCVAWSFSFPSRTERVLWHISCITITAGPALWSLHLGLSIKGITLPRVSWAASWIFGGVVVVPLYLVARIVLLILAFTTLRSLPYGAYKTVYWTTIIPHIY